MTNPTKALAEAVIVDVDGTLCDVEGIRHYVTRSNARRDFESFHKASALCPPIAETLDWVAAHRAAGRRIIVVTARERRWEHLTRTWMRKWEIEHDHLLMRPNFDYRPDTEIKSEILAQITTAGFDVVAAIDDNPSVIALWRSHGIPVTVVPGWPDEAPAS